MYELNDTIAAVSSPSSDKAVILRVTGPETIDIVNKVFTPHVSKTCHSREGGNPETAGITAGFVAVDGEFSIDVRLYLFIEPRSYTGETLAEFHFFANRSVTDALLGRLMSLGIRLAEPGEFTARAYLNGKMDLAQAEAVNQVIVSTNRLQLAAAEKLLTGKLAKTTANICSELVECLSLIEAGLDFSGEDIEFITASQAIDRLNKIRLELEELLSGSISCEEVIELPAVGIAGAPNAGKSSLLNSLLGKERSIVSDQRKTTRDILTGEMTLPSNHCVLFDCAGLIAQPHGILDELAQAAAVEALATAELVIFCVDISKPDLNEDIAIRELIDADTLIAVANKADLPGVADLDQQLATLGEVFDMDFLPVSTKTGLGIEKLKAAIDAKLLELTVPAERAGAIALTNRHKQAVSEAIKDLTESIDQLKQGSEEVTATMLRSAHEHIAGIEQQTIDEQILDNIFSNFCIGK